MTDAEIEALIIAKIKSGNRDTTAEGVREVLDAIKGSFTNTSDGATGPTIINQSFVISATGLYIKSSGPDPYWFKFTVQDDGFIPQQLENTGYNNIQDLLQNI